jgi:type IV pilus assembly protein PilN
MIKINLLPYRESKKQAGVKRHAVLAAAVGVAFLIFVVGIHIFEMTSRADLAKRVQTAETKLQVLSKVAGQIDQVKKDKALLEKKIAIIKNLEENRLKPVLILDDLTALIPPKQIWFSTVSLTENDLRIEGTARDNGAVAQFMKNLERSSFIKSVDLVASKQSLIGAIKLQSFTVSCGLRKGA